MTGCPYRLPAEPVAGIATRLAADRLHVTLAGFDATTRILVLERDATLAR